MCEYNRKAIGVTIRKLLDERDLSQEVLSGLAGIARSHLSMIETDAKQPNFETIWRLACALELELHE